MTDKVQAELEAELASSRRQLVEAHRMASLGRLLAGVVHEINTPVGSILSNNEVLTRSLEMLEKLVESSLTAGSPPPDKAMKILETLRSLALVDRIACERISSVVRGLKTFGRSDAVEFRKADLNEILDNTLKLAQCEFRRRITVETSYGELPEVECDAHLLSQVFLNLLVNAGQAIEGEGVVKIETGSENGLAHVSISDTGCGIPYEKQASIFTAGFTTKPLGVGTGLGLSISRRIVVEIHGGTIDFESEPGKGTTFHLRIPLSRPPRPAQ
jgi:two-component system NtrC family sensor kinase